MILNSKLVLLQLLPSCPLWSVGERVNDDKRRRRRRRRAQTTQFNCHLCALTGRRVSVWESAVLHSARNKEGIMKPGTYVLDGDGYACSGSNCHVAPVEIDGAKLLSSKQAWGMMDTEV